jgi:hypothetical protein
MLRTIICLLIDMSDTAAVESGTVHLSHHVHDVT